MKFMKKGWSTIRSVHRAIASAAAIMCLAIGIPPVIVLAQSFETEPLVTDRPDQTESSNIVQPGFIQLEAGVLFEHESEPVDVDTTTAPQLLVRIGLHRRVELRLSGDGYIDQSVEDDGSTSGWSDTAVGAKVWFWGQQTWVPETAAIFEVSVPTGDSDFTSDGYDPAAILIFSWELPRDFGLGINIGVANPTQGEDDDDRVTETTATAALGIPITERWGAFIEYFGTFRSEDDDDEDDPQAVDGGLTYLVTENLQFDLAGGAGLTDTAPDYFIGIGVAWRFGFGGRSQKRPASADMTIRR